jgi:hypothetical protein
VEPDLAFVNSASRPMPDSVFKKRLQQELRDFGGRRFRLDIVFQQQAVTDPELLDSQVKIGKFQLFGQTADRFSSIL